MAKDEIKHIRDLIHDPNNARKHNSRNIGMIADSLNSVGAARSIVIDENGVILAGNGTIEGAGEAGITKVQVVDADGSTIIAVRRTGLTDEQKVNLALADNRAAEMATWDGEVLAKLLQTDGVKADNYWRADELDGLVVMLNKQADKEKYQDTIDLTAGAKPLSVEPGLGQGPQAPQGPDATGFSGTPGPPPVDNDPGRSSNVTDGHEGGKNDKLVARALRFVDKDLPDDPDEVDRLQPALVALAEAIIRLYDI